METIVKALPKSILVIATSVLIWTAGAGVKSIVVSLRSVDERLADLQVQLAVVQATMVTRAEVIQIVREELDRGGK